MNPYRENEKVELIKLETLKNIAKNAIQEYISKHSEDVIKEINKLLIEAAENGERSVLIRYESDLDKALYESMIPSLEKEYRVGNGSDVMIISGWLK